MAKIPHPFPNRGASDGVTPKVDLVVQHFAKSGFGGAVHCVAKPTLHGFARLVRHRHWRNMVKRAMELEEAEFRFSSRLETPIDPQYSFFKLLQTFSKLLGDVGELRPLLHRSTPRSRLEFTIAAGRACHSSSSLK